jgi:hypothetical protein
VSEREPERTPNLAILATDLESRTTLTREQAPRLERLARGRECRAGGMSSTATRQAATEASPFTSGLVLTTAALGGRTSIAESLAETACAPGYKPCLPVRADLDCGQISDAMKPVRVTGADPYGLDADRDGLGCEVSGKGGGARSPWGLILRKPPRKEATGAKVGDTLTVVGWSPRSMKGKRFLLCAQTGGQIGVVLCMDARKVLSGTVQTFGVWKVVRGQTVRGVLKVSIAAEGKFRAFDTVPVR